MKTSLLRVWQWVKWPLLVLVVLYIALVVWRALVLMGESTTQEAVDRIHAARLTWDDINGSLPPAPDPVENDATLAGVDSNANGIRDDVEIAIYTKYQDEPKVAVAMLQYAKALQKEFTDVYNSATLVAVMQEESRGFSCVGEDVYRDEVEDLVFNLDERKKYREEIRQKYMTSWGIPNVEECDLVV